MSLRSRVLAIGLLLVAGAAAMATLPAVLALTPGWDTAIFFFAATTWTGGAAFLAFRDIYLFAGLAALFSVFVLVGVGLIAAFEAPKPGLLVAGGAAAVGLACALAFLVRTQIGKSPVPDILGEWFGRAAMHETGGVQHVTVFPEGAPANAIVAVEVYLQNCTNGERTVRVELDVKPLFGRGGWIRWRPPPPVVLAPLEVRVVRIPICAARADKLFGTVYILVKASGPAAKRVRPRRAAYAIPPPKTWQFVTVAILALPVLGLELEKEGLSANMYFTPAAPLPAETELPEVTVESIWPEDSRRDESLA